MIISWRFKTLALLGSLFLLFAGCKSAPTPVEQTRERPSRGGQGMQTPSPEELGDSPCGNPNWAKLPPEVVRSPADDSDGEPQEEPTENSNESMTP